MYIAEGKSNSVTAIVIDITEALLAHPFERSLNLRA